MSIISRKRVVFYTSAYGATNLMTEREVDMNECYHLIRSHTHIRTHTFYTSNSTHLQVFLSCVNNFTHTLFLYEGGGVDIFTVPQLAFHSIEQHLTYMLYINVFPKMHHNTSPFVSTV